MQHHPRPRLATSLLPPTFLQRNHRSTNRERPPLHTRTTLDQITSNSCVIIRFQMRKVRLNVSKIYSNDRTCRFGDSMRFVEGNSDGGWRFDEALNGAILRAEHVDILIRSTHEYSRRYSKGVCCCSLDSYRFVFPVRLPVVHIFHTINSYRVSWMANLSNGYIFSGPNQILLPNPTFFFFCLILLFSWTGFFF